MKEKEIYDLEIDRGHILALINGKRVLIDTGSPFSLGQIPLQISKVENEGAIPEEQKTNLLRSIIALSGVNFDAVLGMDLLKRRNFYLNLKEKKAIFSKKRITREQFIFPLSFILGVPKITAVLDGKETPMIVDTGAVISYFDQELIKRKVPTRKHQDFYPLFNVGKFETYVYTMNIEIGKKQLEIEGGVLPQELRNTLKVLNDSSCLLGNPIFEKFSAEFCFLEKKPFLNLAEIGGKN